MYDSKIYYSTTVLVALEYPLHSTSMYKYQYYVLPLQNELILSYWYWYCASWDVGISSYCSWYLPG